VGSAPEEQAIVADHLVEIGLGSIVALYYR
jgi:hypothetical protein